MDMRRIVFALSSLAAVAAPVYAQGVVIEAPNLSLPILIGLALIDSINPCVIGVLILLMTVLLKVGNRKAILSNGAAYTAGVYFTYLIGGMTLLTVFNLARTLTAVSQALYVAIGALVLFAGLLETKDFFWYGRWYSLSIPAGLVHMVEERASGAHASLAAAMSFGFVVTLIELPCTGAPYLAVLTLMSQGGLNYVTALPMLLLYNLVFVLPLLVIIYLAYKGMEMKRLESLRKEHRGLMRLAIGLALLAVGVWIVTAVADVFVPLVLFLSGAIALMAVLKYVFKV